MLARRAGDVRGVVEALSWRRPNGHTAVALSIASLAVLVRIPFLFWPLVSDEGGYAYTAHWWSGGLTLYSPDLSLDRPQGIVAVYSVGMRLLGEATWAIRLWGALWAAAAVLFVYAITRRLWNERAARIAAALCALFGAAPQIEGFTANAETFATAAALASALALLGSRHAVAGALAAVACLLKPSGISAVVFAFVWMAYERAGWRSVARFCLGAVPLALFAVIHGSVTAGWNNYISAAVANGVRAAGTTRGQLKSSLVGAFSTLPVWAPLGLCTVAVWFKLARLHRVFLAALILASLLGLALGGHWFPHYFIQMVPGLAIGAGIAADRCLAGCRRAGAPLVTLLLVIGELLMVRSMIQPPAAGSWSLYRRSGYLIADDVAAYVRAHSTAGDRFYVAFAEADIYHLAGRRSAVPNLFLHELLCHPGAYDRVVDAVDTAVPLYVLALDAPLDNLDPNRRFWRALEANYHVERTFGAARLLRRNGR